MLVMRSRNREARERLEESLEIARTVGARERGGPGAQLPRLRTGVPWRLPRRRSSICARRCGSLARRASQARGLSQYENLSEVLSEAGQLEHARDIAAEGIAAAQEVGLQRSYGLVLMGRGALCALALGRTTEAGELTNAALELGEQTFFAFNVLDARGRYELVRGEFDAAERHLAAADAMASRVGDPMWTGPVAAARAELELWRGQAQQAAEIVRAALAIEPERQCLQHTSELHAVGARALAELAAAARARHQDSAAGAEAAVLLDRLESTLTSAFPLGPVPPRVSADVALCRAEVRRAFGHSDHDAWAAAVTAADAAGYSNRSIYARWRLTEALLEHSIRDRAEPALREAAHRAAAIRARAADPRDRGSGPTRADLAHNRSRPERARPLRPHPTRDRGAGAPCRRPHQQADRRHALHQRQDRRAPRFAHPRQARRQHANGRGIASTPAWDPADRRGLGVKCTERGRAVRVGVRHAAHPWPKRSRNQGATVSWTSSPLKMGQASAGVSGGGPSYKSHAVLYVSPVQGIAGEVKRGLCALRQSVSLFRGCHRWP